MSATIKNLLFLLLSAALFYLVAGQMRKWMDSKQVVAFEFLRTEAATNTLLSSDDWLTTDANPISKTVKLRNHTHWDFLYIISYTLLLLSIARMLLGGAHRHLKMMALILLAAGFSDFIENIFLLHILDGGRGIFPAAMFCFATLKFSLLGVFVVWAGISVVKKPNHWHTRM